MTFGCRHPFRPRGLCIVAALLSLASLMSPAEAAFCTAVPGSCWPSPTRWAAFLKTLSNATAVYTPDGTPDLFLSEATSMNLLTNNFPGIIIVPGTEADLRAAMYFASKTRIRVVARCSGHDFNGRSNGRGVMLIKTERLNWVTYDNATQTVSFGSGANHALVYGALVPHKRVYIGGQSKTVCPAGCLAGGCHGLLSRQYGLGIDSILSIRLALFNGTVITADRTRSADLFHAYLGAGHNSFGLAVSFRAQTHPAPPAIVTVDAVFAVKSNQTGRNLLSDFFFNISWYKSMPRELAGNINIDSGKANVKLVYFGTDYDSIAAKLRPLFESPYAVLVNEPRSFSDMFDLAVNIYPPESVIWARRFMTSVFLPEDERILSEVASVVTATNPYLWLWFLFGGAVLEHAGTGSVPAGMRTAMYAMVVSARWINPHEDPSRVASLDPYLPVMYSASAASYNNEFTSWGSHNQVDDWKTRFFADYAAVLSVKKKYDPCNLMTAKYAVGSDEPAAICSCAPKSG